MSNTNLLFQNFLRVNSHQFLRGENVSFSVLLLKKMYAALSAANYPGMEGISALLGVDSKGAMELLKVKLSQLLAPQGVTLTETMTAIGDDWEEQFSKMVAVLGSQSMFVYQPTKSTLAQHVQYYLQADASEIKLLGPVFGSALVASMRQQTVIWAGRFARQNFQTFLGPFKSVNTMLYQGENVVFETKTFQLVGVPVIVGRNNTTPLLRLMVMSKRMSYFEEVLNDLVSGQLVNWFRNSKMTRKPILIPVRDDFFGTSILDCSTLIGRGGATSTSDVFPNVLMRVEDRVVPNTETYVDPNKVYELDFTIKFLSSFYDILFDPRNKLVLSATFVGDFFGKEVSS